jgi:hypothetical protein
MAEKKRTGAGVTKHVKPLRHAVARIPSEPEWGAYQDVLDLSKKY